MDGPRQVQKNGLNSIKDSSDNILKNLSSRDHYYSIAAYCCIRARVYIGKQGLKLCDCILLYYLPILEICESICVENEIQIVNLSKALIQCLMTLYAKKRGKNTCSLLNKSKISKVKTQSIVRSVVIPQNLW